MNTYTKIYLTCLFIYILIAEAAIYIEVNHLTVNPFLAVNGQIILIGGGVLLFIGGLIGFMEEFWG